MGVYFIQAGQNGPIKIGRALRPAARLTKLQTANPEVLTLLKVIAGWEREERAIHLWFAAQRIRGEWFAPSTELLAFIKGAAPILDALAPKPTPVPATAPNE